MNSISKIERVGNSISIESYSISAKTVISFLIFFTPFSLGLLIKLYYPVAIISIFLLIFFNFDKLNNLKRNLKDNFSIPTLIFIASFFLSIYFGLPYKSMSGFTDYDSSFNGVFLNSIFSAIVTPLLIYLIYFSIESIEELIYYIRIFFLSGIVLMFLSFYYVSSNIFIVERLGVTFNDTNYFGRFQVFMIIINLCYILFYENSVYKKIFLIVISSIYLYLLMLSSSRSAMIVFGIISVIITFYSKSKTLKISLIAVNVIVIGYLLAYAATVKVSGLAEGTGILGSFMDLSNATRVALNIAAFNMFVDNPFFGVGYLNFYNAYINFDYIPVGMPLGINVSVVHSWLFSILGEQGLLGIISFLWIVFLYVKNYYKKNKKCVNADYKFVGITYFSLYLALIINGLFFPVFFTEYFFILISGLSLGYFKVFENSSIFISNSDL